MTNQQDQIQLSIEEQEALLEKYDSEARSRKLTGLINYIVIAILLAFALFQLYTGWYGVFPSQIQRSIHLGFAMVLIILLYPATKKAKRNQIPWYDYLVALIALIVAAFWPVFYSSLVQKIGGLNLIEFIIGLLAILLVLEVTRRVVGLPIVIITIVFLLYALFGQFIPGTLGHPGLSIEQLVKHMYFTTDGILGVPISVSATYIFLFIMFGSFLMQTGVGNYFNELAISIAGRRTGGPAKVAIFTSALEGTISGSSVANVVQSGSYTIPLMKKLGYNKNFAGAVEAAASTGGQIMPPVMGAAAFLMVEFAGVPYIEIVKAAVIPAILYFTGIWIMTHFEAKRTGLKGLPKDQMPPKLEVIKKIYLLTPIIAIIVFMDIGRSISQAAILGILFTIFVSLFRKDTRINFSKLILALVEGAKMALGVAAATACAGMIVGVVTKTGLGLTLGHSIIGLASFITSDPQGLLILTLFFTMITSIIIGMGSPTTANYIITSTIALPAIMALNTQFEYGIPVLAAHMFVFYFGIVADITPPVALAAFAATGISGGDPIKTGVNATKLAIAAFIIPYMFVMSPQLLMINTTFLEVIWIIFTAITGMVAIGAGIIGYWYKGLNWVERIISVVIGLLLIYPEGYSDMIGLIGFIIMVVYQFFFGKGKGTGTGATKELSV